MYQVLGINSSCLKGGVQLWRNLLSSVTNRHRLYTAVGLAFLALAFLVASADVVVVRNRLASGAARRLAGTSFSLLCFFLCDPLVLE